MNDRLRSAIENAIGAATGEPARLSESSSLSGGCIHSSRKLILEDGRIFFCKVGSGEPKDILEREFEGLRALGRADSIRTVKPLAHQSLPELGNQFLITEFVPPGKPRSAFFERFGRGLARLHRNWTAPLSRAFYDSYRETWPLQAGAQERIEVYQLYHLLNHLNLFGTGYLAGCLDLRRRILL